MGGGFDIAKFSKNAFLAFFGLSSGLVIAGAVFAFITVIGVVPRLAQKTQTQKYFKVYEEAILLGGTGGVVLGLFHINLPIGVTATVAASFLSGIFFGCLAVSLAEVINVIPIMTRRLRISQGMFCFILALALGKLTGALLYFLMPGYYR